MRIARKQPRPVRVQSTAVPAETLEQAFPRLGLPIQPPYPPAEAKSVKDVPREPGWLYEPKWDGFRSLAFRSGNEIVLQSKAGQPLGRYFPEVTAALSALTVRKFILDGEIVIRSSTGLDFDALLQRIHPAASRIQRLSQETPATYMLFDILLDAKGKSIVTAPLSERRKVLQEFADRHFSIKSAAKQTKGKHSGGVAERIILSPASPDFSIAEKWMRQGAAHGWDGVVAKRLNCEYTSGERTGMVKVKRIRTADCVIGGFRWGRGSAAKKQMPQMLKDQPKKSVRSCWACTTLAVVWTMLVSAPALRGKAARN
jgi:ATP-dependent DNA ligase